MKKTLATLICVLAVSAPAIAGEIPFDYVPPPPPPPCTENCLMAQEGTPSIPTATSESIPESAVGSFMAFVINLFAIA
jgi:hypothetical protein